MEKKLEISWSAPEFVHYPKSKTWFGVFAVMGLALVGYFLTQKDFLTSSMFLLLFLMLMFVARAKPRQIEVTLSGRGIKLNETIVPYQQIKSFWLVYEPDQVKTLNFETTAYLNRFLTVQLADQDPVAVREYLLDFLPEDLDREERVIDRISRTLKF